MEIKKVLSLFFFVSIFVLSSGFFLTSRYFKIVDIGGKKFIMEIVSTAEKQEKGLSGRRSLCTSCAMLFDFKEKRQHPFWMKDMKFDLDIIWVSDERIVHIKKNFSYKAKEIIVPEFKSNRVIEIRAGLSDKYNIKVGDVIKIY